jgi:predicted dehydrogenase
MPPTKKTAKKRRKRTSTRRGTVRVGIIGAGGIAQAHARHLQTIDDVELRAVCDVREEAAEDIARKFDVPKTFPHYKDLLREKHIDAVSVCTPNYFHAEPTIAALKAGKHVIVEKPMAMNVAEAEAMVKAAEKARKVLVVGFQFRYTPNAQMLKRASADGRLGRILYARCQALRHPA